jgi:hypothetical protein
VKLRLVQKGFEGYNGQMGVIFFENGLSTNDVRPLDAIRMSAVMQCEWENGQSASIAQSLLDNANTPAPMFTSDGQGTDADNERAAVEKVELARAVTQGIASQATGADHPATSGYSKDQLAAIADAEGIAGLRKVADPLGVKGNSINGLIDAILKTSNSEVM